MNKREGSLESSWTSLRQETEVWRSTMEYWIDQLSAFQSLLDRSGHKAQSPDQVDRVRHFKETIRLYGEDVLPDMKNRLSEHLKSLIAKKKKPYSPKADIVRKHAGMSTKIDKLERALEVQLTEFRAISEENGISTGPPSLNLNCILIPTDFSPNAQHATDYAMTLFRHNAERIILLHVRSHPYVISEAHSLAVMSVREEDEARFEAENERLSLAFPANKHKIETLSLTGFVTEKIAEAARNNKADLIVMGPGEASETSKFIFGSNTLSVMGSINVPTLIIPSETPLLQPDHIMLALDLKLEERPAHFDLLTSIQNHFSSRMEIVHIDTHDTEQSSSRDLKMENDLLETLGLPDGSVEHITGKQVKEALNDLVSDRSVDLLCVIGHPHSWIHIAVGKSVAHQMVIDTHIPILVLHQ